MSWETGSGMDSDPQWEALRKAERRARLQDQAITAVAGFLAGVLAALGGALALLGEFLKGGIFLALAVALVMVARWHPSFVKINDEDVPR